MSGNFEYQWGQLVARAWDDPAFKTMLLADPSGVLKENGLDAPAGRQFKVVEIADEAAENADDVVHLVLPARPAAAELSEEELVGVAAGGGHDHGHEGCHRCGDGCNRCSDNCRRCSDEGCYRCERC